MEKIWPYAWAFSIGCIIFTACKVFGLEWAAKRSWGEVIAWFIVAVLIIVAFFLRRRIAGIFAKIKAKLD